MQAAVVKADYELDQLDNNMIQALPLAFSLLFYQQHCGCDSVRFRVFSDYLMVQSRFFLHLNCSWVRRRQNQELLVLKSNYSSHNSDALTQCRLWSDILGVPNFWPVLAVCTFSVRRGAKITHTAIKDDNNTVHAGNFGRRSAILLTFIGSHQCHLNCINTEWRDQSVSQSPHRSDHWGKSQIISRNL